MNYYLVTTSFNDEVVGTVSQVEKAIYHCDIWNEPKFIERITFQKVDFVPIIAKATWTNLQAKLKSLIESKGGQVVVKTPKQVNLDIKKVKTALKSDVPINFVLCK